MNTLLLYDENTKLKDCPIIRNLKDIFRAYGFNLSTDIKKINFQVILLTDYKLIDLATALQKENNVPIILVYKKSDPLTAYSVEQEVIDYSIEFNDKDVNAIFPAYKRKVTLDMPLFMNDLNLRKEKLTNNNEPLSLYIDIDSSWENNPLFKLFRVANQLTKYNITIRTSNEETLKGLNNNVQIVSDNNIEDRVIKSDIVIGSGYSILYALKHNKPSIVLGEKGYGGIVTTETFDKLYDLFFQGRVGGVYGEYIPERLVLEDIEILTHQIYSNNFNNDEIRENLLTKLQLNSELLFNTLSLVKEKYTQISKDETQKPLIFNSDYTLIKSHDRYWIRNRYTKQVLGWYDNKQYEVLDHFISTPSSIIEYLKSRINRDEDLAFLQSSLIDKVLIPFID